MLLKEKTQAVFNKSSKTYNENRYIQNEIALRLLERLSYIKLNPKNILDLGGATGKVATDLAAIYPESNIINLDIAHELLIQSNSSINVNADYNSIPFSDNSFELIIANLSLIWAEDMTKAITNIYNTMTNNSLLLFSTFGPDTWNELLESPQRSAKEVIKNNFYDMHIIGDLVKSTGFSDPVMDKETINIEFGSRDRLIADLKYSGVISANALLDNSLEKVVLNHHQNHEGSDVYPVSLEVIIGTCWKTAPKSNNYIAVDSIKRL